MYSRSSNWIDLLSFCNWHTGAERAGQTYIYLLCPFHSNISLYWDLDQDVPVFQRKSGIWCEGMRKEKKSAVIFEHHGRGLAWKHCVPICELWESQGLWEGLQVGRHWLLKITAMTSSSLCRLRHKTQSNETRKGRKRQGGEAEKGVLLMVRYTGTGTRRLRGSNDDFIWINYILITVTNFFICVSGIFMKFLILLSLHFFFFIT